MTKKNPFRRLTLTINEKKKRRTRAQFAALPFRFGDDGLEVLLITSRRTKRWIVPKGWGENGLTPPESAKIEAWQEAGVKGQCEDRPLGVYSSEKRLRAGEIVPCVVIVYPMEVETIKKKFPEHKERKRKWVSPKTAADMVDEDGLKTLLKMFPDEIARIKAFSKHQNTLTSQE